MPEGPECRWIGLALADALNGHKIRSLRVLRDSVARYTANPLELASGKTIERVFCKGKVIAIDLGDACLTIQLGMAGTFVRQRSPKLKYATIELWAEDRALYFIDQRRFGSWILFLEGEEITPISKLGPEVTDKEFNPDYLLEKAKGRRKALKPFLMNQAIVAGLGNIYTAEALWNCQLSPFMAAGELTPDQAKLVCDSTKDTIKTAINLGSSIWQRISRRMPKGGEAFRGRKIYQRKSCPRCGNASSREKQDNRTTWFCRTCQVAS